MPRIAHLGFVGPPPGNLRMFRGMGYWRNWREAVHPALEEMSFNLKKMAFS